MKRFLLVGSPLGYLLKVSQPKTLMGQKRFPFSGWKKKQISCLWKQRLHYTSITPTQNSCTIFLLGPPSNIFPATFASTWIFPPFFWREIQRALISIGFGGSQGRGVFVGDQIGISPKNISTKKQTGPKLEAIVFFCYNNPLMLHPGGVNFFLIHPTWTGQKKHPAKEDFGFINQTSKLEKIAFSRLFVDGMILLIRFRNPARKPPGMFIFKKKTMNHLVKL